MGKRRNYWALLKTKQASSGDAVRNVTAQGFPVYHPMFRERRVLGARRVRALFPFYLIVSVSRRDREWEKLHSTRGVSHLFMSGNIPSQIPDKDIENFRGLENSLGYIELDEHEAPRFTTDQCVLGVSGLFQDKFGIYQGLAGTRTDRVKVLFDILGRPTVFEVDAHGLVAA